MPAGVIQCFQAWDRGFCWEKLTQFGLDIGVLIITSIQLALHCVKEFSTVRIRYWLYIMIILTVLSNFLHQILFKVYLLFDLSTLFFNIYYSTILYYAGIKLIQRIEQKKLPLRVIKILYVFVFVLHLALFFMSVFSDGQRCIDIWYLIVRTFGFLLGIGLCVVGRFHQKRAQQKLKSVQSVKVVSNPIPKLWCWVSLNIIAQLINLVRTFVFAFVQALDCQYDKQNMDINFFIELIMVITTFYMPLLSTIYIFWAPLKRFRRRSRKESQTCQPCEQFIGMELIALGDITGAKQDSL